MQVSFNLNTVICNLHKLYQTAFWYLIDRACLELKLPPVKRCPPLWSRACSVSLKSATESCSVRKHLSCDTNTLALMRCPLERGTSLAVVPFPPAMKTDADIAQQSAHLLPDD